MPVKPIPDGFHAVTPYLIIKGVPKLIEFLEQAFDAATEMTTRRPDGSIAHATLRIGGSPIMMGEAAEEWPAMPASIYLYVPDADKAFRRALLAGATTVMEPSDQFYGDRNGGVRDFAGNMWWISTHIEDVSPEEIQRRAAEFT